MFTKSSGFTIPLPTSLLSSISSFMVTSNMMYSYLNVGSAVSYNVDTVFISHLGFPFTTVKFDPWDFLAVVESNSAGNSNPVLKFTSTFAWLTVFKIFDAISSNTGVN